MRLRGAVRYDWQVTADCEDAEGRPQLVPRLKDEDRPDRHGGAHRRVDDRREVGFRGRRVHEVGGRGVALALGRCLIVVANLGDGQDRQRNHDRDEASPHLDILVRKQGGVKEQTPNFRAS